MSQKNGKPDLRAAYGLHGQEMIAWLTHLQHTRAKHIWFVGILDEKVDDYNRRFYQVQIEGSKTGLELPGIVDEVITMSDITDKDSNTYHAFICQTMNPYGYPAKDRSRRLDCIEEPHLGRLMEKIKQKAPDINTQLHYSIPQPQPQPQPETKGDFIMSNVNQNHVPLWNDFNTAESQQYDVIPTGTIVPVCMTIKPGGYDDPSQNWDGGYATYNQATGSVYLSCEFIVLGGEFSKRKLWGLIGLHSAKGATWQNMGRFVYSWLIKLSLRLIRQG